MDLCNKIDGVYARGVHEGGRSMAFTTSFTKAQGIRRSGVDEVACRSEY